MKHHATFMSLAVAALVALTPASALADDDDRSYSVTLTNITSGQLLTPPLVFSHPKNTMPFYRLGHQASSELEQLAEGGDTGPLLGRMMSKGHVTDYAIAFGAAGPIAPGESVTVELMADKRGGIGLATMLLPTNDGFAAAHGIPLAKDDYVVTRTLAAMDAGTEPNDENCAHIPGPHCKGMGYSPGDDADHVPVHTHGGIHGVMDLVAADRDWRNPVLQVTVQRIDD